jgi:Ni/Co efflux regulator RcnB
MIRKGESRFSEKIMLKQGDEIVVLRITISSREGPIALHVQDGRAMVRESHSRDRHRTRSHPPDAPADH